MIPISPKALQPPPAFPQNVAETACEDTLVSLSSEMIEIAVDMMARYTFSSSLTQPKRSAVVEQLLANGSSRSWLLGNVLVTVTVSKQSPANVLCPYCSPGVPFVTETTKRKESGSTAYGSSSIGDSTKTEELKKLHENRLLEHDSSSHKNESFATRETFRHDEITGGTNSNTGANGSRQRVNPAGDRASETRSTTTPREVTASEERSTSDGCKPRDVTKENLSTAEQCSCVCQGWAEFLVRRPTGNTSWILRLQNRPKLAGNVSSTQSFASPMCPEIYESVIPKAFFDELATDLEQEKLAEQTAITSVRVLSKSEDSDTLVLDLLHDTRTEDGLQDMRTEDGQGKTEGDNITGGNILDGNQLETDIMDDRTQNVDVSDDEERKVDIVEQGDIDSDNIARTVKFQDNTGGRTSPSSSSRTSNDSGDRLNLASSFLERTRLLSHSPMDGPSAFMLLEKSVGQKLDVQPQNTTEGADEDLRIKQKFQKPIVGKSPLDASPIKTRLHQEGAGEEHEKNLEDRESDVDISIDDEGSEMNDIQSAHHLRDPDSTTSLPGSRTQSPFVGVSHRFSESSGGSSSLPASPRLSPKRLQRTPTKFSSQRSGRRQSRNEDRYCGGRITPVENSQGSTGVAMKRDPMKEKSATVDLGMLRRISSSPEMNEPVKEKRGIMKFFAADVVGDKNGKEKNLEVPLRRQTMSGTQLRALRMSKRRSYSGPFPSSTANGPEEKTAHASSDALSPNFIFLQFYHSSWFGEDEVPLALPEQEFFHRAVKNLDRIPAYDTHKIGVIYVGPNQADDEVAILRNLYGPSRYMNFLSGLGELIRLRDCSLSEVYTGGLDRNGADGEYAYNWRSEIAQIIFHVATLMPNKDNDPNCHSKKLHIGNDFVTIVYNDSKAKYNIGTIKGQFNFVEIVIKPLDNESNVITVSVKDELKDILTDTNRGPRVVSDKNLATLVRHIALHVNMASVIHQSQKTPSDAYGCNWLQRLRQIKRIQSRVTCATESQGATGSVSRRTRNDLASIVDFTGYIL